MKITVIGKGNVGGGLAARLREAGHEVAALGREGGDAGGSEVVIVAVPSESIAGALAGVSGLDGQLTIDACNARGGRDEAFASLAHQVKAVVGGPTAKAFNINFAALYDQIEAQSSRPSNFYAAEPEADETVARLIRDVGYDPISVGGLDQARALEDYAPLAGAIAGAGLGPYFYRVAAPGEL